ncbi:MAG: hypothetical protein ABIR62_09840 [Dokdonella sp.]|uniref:hypothetical protein n=1 Tax=Dokdonella sp. TaxID=2291710 RepID=UPI00326773E7
MSQQIRYGAILISGSAVLLLMSVVHPSAIPFGDEVALARMAIVDAFAHSLAIVGVWLLLVGQAGLSRTLGLQRPMVAAALLASAMASTGLVVAAALDGFVIPRIAHEWTGADATARAGLEQLIRFCVLAASSLTRIYIMMVALAILLWSWVIRSDRLDAALPWVGGIVGLAGFATLFGGPAYVHVHELMLLVLGQSVWMVWAGMWMIRTDRTAAPWREENPYSQT